MKKQITFNLTPTQTELINSFNREWYNASRTSEIRVSELATSLNQPETETLKTVLELVTMGVLVHHNGEVFITVKASHLISKAI